MAETWDQNGVYRKTIVFSSRERDRSGQIRMDALFSRLQYIAGDHCDALGFGRSTALEHGCFWALTNTELTLEGVIPTDTFLRLVTWNGRQGHGLFWRHYRLETDKGKVLARAVSIWVLMDLTERKLSRNWRWVQFAPLKAEGALPERLRAEPIPTDLPFAGTRSVQPEELDENGHMNNSHYIPWAMDLVPEDHVRSHTLARVVVEYRRELLYGQTAELFARMEESSLLLRAFADGHDSFDVRLDYVPV